MENRKKTANDFKKNRKNVTGKRGNLCLGCEFLGEYSQHNSSLAIGLEGVRYIFVLEVYNSIMQSTFLPWFQRKLSGTNFAIINAS